MYFTREELFILNLANEIKRRHRKKGIHFSPRERDVLAMAANGETTVKGLGAALGVSPRTAEIYKKHLYEKLNIHTAAKLTLYAIRYRKQQEESRISICT